MQVYGEMDVYRRAVVVHKENDVMLACSTPFRSVPAAPPSPPSPPSPPIPLPPPSPSPPPPSPSPPPPSPSPLGSVEYVVTFPDRGPGYPKGTITLSQDSP